MLLTLSPSLVAGMDVDEAIELIKNERPDLKSVVKVHEVGGAV